MHEDMKNPLENVNDAVYFPKLCRPLSMGRNIDNQVLFPIRVIAIPRLRT